MVLLEQEVSLRCQSLFELEEIDLAILDIGLPDMRGDKVFSIIKKRRPELKIIISSGYSAEDVVKNMNIPADGIIQKPCSYSTLSMKIREVLGKKGVVNT